MSRHTLRDDDKFEVVVGLGSSVVYVLLAGV